MQQRFELALFQGCNESRVIRPNPELIDRHRQLRPTIQFNHFAVLEDLVAPVLQLLAAFQALYRAQIAE
jgi:hypothetical protein